MPKYRPPGFDAEVIANETIKQWNISDGEEKARHISYALVEAGADAFVDALRKTGKRIPTSLAQKEGINPELLKGIIVFIPDDTPGKTLDSP